MRSFLIAFDGSTTFTETYVIDEPKSNKKKAKHAFRAPELVRTIVIHLSIRRVHT